MRIVFPPRWELDFQGLVASKSDIFCHSFWKGSKGRSGETFLTGGADLGSPVGSQRGSILEEKASLFEV